MTEEQLIFDSVTKKDGGIYFETEKDTILKEIKEYVYLFINRVRKEYPCIPMIDIEFVDNNALNAYAFTWNNKYFIGIFKGAVNQIHEIFNLIGDNKEIYISDYFNDISDKEFKEKCVKYCILFLITHEMSHIRFGHCNYSSSKGKIFLNEFVKLTQNEEEGLESQTLEFDADCCAIATIVNRFIKDSYGNNKEEKCKKSYEELRFLVFSVYYLFRIFAGNINVKSFTLNQLRLMDHPHDGIRQCYILSNIATLFINILGKNSNIVTEILQKIVDISFLAEKLYQKKIEKTNISIMMGYTEVGATHLNDISNYWGIVRPKLLQYSHDNLAPYEKFDSKIVLLK